MDADSTDIEDCRLVLVQSALPFYRRAFLGLLAVAAPNLVVLTGTQQFEQSVTVGVASGDFGTQIIENWYSPGRRLLWQSGVVKTALRADVAILELNPRILNSWLVAAARRLLGRPTVFWGHAFSRRGPEHWTNRVRRLQQLLGDSTLVYTEDEVAALGGPQAVYAMGNALYRQRDIQPVAERERRDFVYVGRLVPSKKPSLLVEGFLRALPTLDDCRLHLVGSGVEEPRLRSMVPTEYVDRVIFHGEVTDLDGLRSIYTESVAAVSPGYAGLSVVQALSFGIPVLVAEDEPHAPEISALIEGETGRYFRSDDATALAELLKEVYRRRDWWSSRGDELADYARENFSAESMVQATKRAITQARLNH